VIQLAPQMRVLLCIEPADFRKNAGLTVMRSPWDWSQKLRVKSRGCLHIDSA
jgi:hypothetical protein